MSKSACFELPDLLPDAKMLKLRIITKCRGMENSHGYGRVATGFIGGTGFSLLAIGVEPVLETALYAAVGAIVSFTVSVLLRFIWERIREL